MWSEKIAPFLPIIFFILFLLLSFFLNYIASLYSEADLFKIDFTKKQKDKNTKKLIFILKNNQILFMIVSFLQVMLNFFISVTFLERIDQKFFEIVNKFLFLLLLGLLVAFFTEVFARWLGSKPFSKKLVESSFFIGIAYTLIRPFTFFRWLLRPKKKIFINSENDILLFVNNLAAENVLEKKEAKLVQSAFNFDEFRVKSVFVPYNKVVFLNENMKNEEIEKIYLKNFFTRYPVLNKDKEIIGVFNLKKFHWELIKDKNANWKSKIDKQFVSVSPYQKLDKVFEKLQNNYQQLAIVQIKKRFLGIITLQNVLEALVGKMKDEKDILFQSNPLN